ncbi:MAG: amidohydrolase [Alphaproteobacteria bacterium]|nr:MAG: amidohydrolase [Alphaproteobacteria bacterium]
MKIRNSIQALKNEFAAYRRELHQNPQTSFEESFISDFIASKLSAWGIEHERGIGGETGIVVTIHGQSNTSGKVIALRADMDALDIAETQNKDWVSKTDGKMHGCGHDGHSTCLLATAKYLKENNGFDGVLHLIFQPAEETGEGARAMMKDGLFERFPCDAIYAMHNWPYAPLGQFDINVGPTMASVDRFEIIIQGKGGHASKPYTLIDPITIAAQIVNGLQTIISRETDALDSAVLSITNINGGTGAFNVIPDQVTLSGTVRTYSEALKTKIEKRIGEISSGISESYGATTHYTYTRMIEPTINDPKHAKTCAEVAQSQGAIVITDGNPSMGGEDFGAFLQVIPGAYVKIGQAIEGDTQHRCSQGLHNAGYDFNDDLIPIATEYWVRLVEHVLKV